MFQELLLEYHYRRARRALCKARVCELRMKAWLEEYSRHLKKIKSQEESEVVRP